MKLQATEIQRCGSWLETLCSKLLYRIWQFPMSGQMELELETRGMEQLTNVYTTSSEELQKSFNVTMDSHLVPESH